MVSFLLHEELVTSQVFTFNLKKNFLQSDGLAKVKKIKYGYEFLRITLRSNLMFSQNAFIFSEELEST